MNSIEYFFHCFLANYRKLTELIEQFEKAIMTREKRIEVAPVYADLAISLMCRQNIAKGFSNDYND
jgi:hypothetical protein